MLRNGWIGSLGLNWRKSMHNQMDGYQAAQLSSAKAQEDRCVRILLRSSKRKEGKSKNICQVMFRRWSRLSVSFSRRVVCTNNRHGQDTYIILFLPRSSISKCRIHLKHTHTHTHKKSYHYNTSLRVLKEIQRVLKEIQRIFLCPCPLYQ